MQEYEHRSAQMQPRNLSINTANTEINTVNTEIFHKYRKYKISVNTYSLLYQYVILRRRAC